MNNFVEGDAGAAASCPRGVSALDDEVIDHTVEDEPVVEISVDKACDLRHGLGREVLE